MNKPVAYWDGKHFASKDKSSLADIPLYTKKQLEEARKLGMQQERALWNLAESTQEFESFDRTASHMAGEYVGLKSDVKVNQEFNSSQVKELNNGGEPVKNATYWKRQYNLMATQNDNLKSGLYHANEQIKYLESHPVKELTDEEIMEIVEESYMPQGLDKSRYTMFAKAILRKAQEK